MRDFAPEEGFADGAFGNESMNMGIPLERAAKGVKNADKAWDKMFGFIDVVEHAKNDGLNSMKKTVQKRTVTAEENAKIIRNSEDAVPMRTRNHLDGHRSGTLKGIKVAAGRAKPAFAMEWDKLQGTTRRAAVHSAAIRRITAVNHALNVFKNDWASFEGILDFLKMVRKNLLQNVHGNIIQQKFGFRSPSRLRGQGC